MAFSKKSVIMHPCARSERLLIENIDDETVIYDEESKTAHALKPLAAAVFLYADGKNSLGEIAELASYRLGTAVSEAQISEAVTELDECALLDVPELEDGVSRRDALKRFGAVGVAAGAGTMLISSIAAPIASAGIANNGANYVCGTGANPVTGQGSAKGQSWPQPPVASNWADWIGVACNTTTIVNYNCVVSGGPNGGTYKNVPADSCLSGDFCVNSSNSYYEASSASQCTSDSNSVCQGFDKNGNQLSISFSVPADLCVAAGGTSRNPTPAGAFCTDKTNDFIASETTESGCTSVGGIWVNLASSAKVKYATAPGGNWVTSPGTLEPTSTSSTNGEYVGVPCDGNVNGAHYQCAEVACVTTSLAKQAPFINSESAFLSSYSVSGEFSGWPAKYCASGKCNETGTCS